MALKKSFRYTWIVVSVVIGILVFAYVAGLIGNKSETKPRQIRQATAQTIAEPDAALRDSIVNYSNGLLNTPYVAAGCSPDGFDCSGFVFYVFRNFGIEVPRSTSQFENFGMEVPIEEVKKGDLLLFLSPTRNTIGHIGIVSKAEGKNSDFIHASSGRDMQVIITSLSNAGYTRRFVKAVRVIGL